MSCGRVGTSMEEAIFLASRSRRSSACASRSERVVDGKSRVSKFVPFASMFDI